MNETVSPFLPTRGLTSAETAAALTWALHHHLPVEVERDDDGGVFLTFDVGAAHGMPEGHVVWTLAREARRLVVFDVRDGRIAGDTMEARLVDLLAALGARLRGLTAAV